jgi:hypothetical protein
MAASNKVFVSPGVYTTETELSFVAQSVGVTTLGIVGETLKGPAFEPLFVRNYDEFQAYFGTTSPEKFVNTQIPKYELAYIAKAYLQQSNQLFVSRILGLSGYDAGPSWTIYTIGNLDPSTVEFDTGPTSFTLPFTVDTNSDVTTIDITDAGFVLVEPIFNRLYTKYNGSTSSFSADVESFLAAIVADPGSQNDSSIVWGGIPSSDYNTLVTTYNVVTNSYALPQLSFSAITLTDDKNQVWYYSTFENTSANIYEGTSMFMYIINFVDNGDGTYAGDLVGDLFEWDGTAYADYNNVVAATLRSRGITEYSTTSSGPSYQVTGLTDVGLVTAGTYSNISSNPYATFALSGVQSNSVSFSFEVSFDGSQANYISKVLGQGNFEKERTDFPIFVEEQYSTLISYGYNKGYIRGLRPVLLSLPSAESLDQTSIANYLERYQSASSPWVVSELRGNSVYQLFKYITISDGNASNTDVKVSLANMSFETNTFDLLVRSYFDTDASPVVLEKYTNCTMDPSSNSFVGKKVGSADGQYEIISKYIMLQLNPDAPADSLPCGFEGYLIRTYSGSTAPYDVAPPFPIYKTKYYTPGEVVYNPPFGLNSGDDNSTISNGENARRSYLGFSTSIGQDVNLFAYKGQQTPSGFTCTEQSYENWTIQTKGFHMDSGATVVTISSIYSNSGSTAFEVGAGQFNVEPLNSNEVYYRIFSRKFTVLPYGGFDGWDIYRERRTNTDEFQLGKGGYLAGARQGCQPFPNATGWGAFRQITVEDNTTDYANTDYYAYRLGIETFNNPAIININVFATPGIDYLNNEALVRYSIDMVETDRADSIYVTTTPDFDLLQPSLSMDNFIYPQDAVDFLYDTNIDSNYTVTYYPWVLTRDSVFNTQIYIPATAEVCRNLALTDNTSFPWFATAGYTRGIVNSVRARRRLTQLDRDTLYQGRINPIATFNDVGTVIWGNKTLQLRESPLDRVNVRRLLLQARKLISAVAIRLLFEQNDAVVRQQFLDSVNPILDAIRRDRGITDFRVTVSSTPEELDSNQMSGRIFLKPTKALEFIDIEFVITPQGASFENI